MIVFVWVLYNSVMLFLIRRRREPSSPEKPDAPETTLGFAARPCSVYLFIISLIPI
ncbi:hypothetical protein HanPSC8_Chr03g0106021 [Helianthus annuus]|nr:hypothetical protein HanPSC8_Chr13g0566461 [Helianthus annuus]KAJ0943551.1 hypothetical protein HanPSC8_Chr03g0106021 [Helianthus annuus]